MQPPVPSRGIVYEVDLEADADIEAPFDTWLRDHIADMLQFDGFQSAEILEDRAAPPGRIRRIVQYRLRDQQALDDYLANHAPRMQAAGVARFGNRYAAGRRVLPYREEFVRGAVSTENCLNCGEVLTGQHCSHCGQPAKVRVLSLWGLTKDVLGDVLDVDSRVWRTLRPLAFRPGLLTQEYLRGRRASYTPPFRMYLVLSLVFFVLASFDDPGQAVEFRPGTEFQVKIEGDTPSDTPAAPGSPAADETAAAPGAADPAVAPPALDAETRQLIENLVSRVPEAARADLRKEMQATLAAATPEERAAAARVIEDPCGEQNFKVEAGPFMERYEPRLRDACRRIMADQQSFGRALWNNVPKMMFLFLPLIAAVLAILYLRSGRYYVEHLLFVVHFHAFFFLAGIGVLVLQRLAAWSSPPLSSAFSVAEGFLLTALVFYVPWYLLRAMRRVYQQGWWKTVPKYALLGFAYLVSLGITVAGLLFYTALTI